MLPAPSPLPHCLCMQYQIIVSPSRHHMLSYNSSLQFPGAVQYIRARLSHCHCYWQTVGYLQFGRELPPITLKAVRLTLLRLQTLAVMHCVRWSSRVAQSGQECRVVLVPNILRVSLDPLLSPVASQSRYTVMGLCICACAFTILQNACTHR